MRMNVFLIGFMGSGKSVVGKKLSEVLKTNFIDLDAFIEESSGKSIPELFAVSQTYFRYLEYNALRKVVGENKNAVIALGGGTPCYFNNMSYLLGNGKTAYLKVNPEVLYERLKNDSKRPLLQKKNEDELKDYISKTLSGREGYYSRAQTILNGEQDIEQILKELLN